MAVSVVNIYNMALGWLGGHQLPSTQAAWEEGSIGRLCQTYFPQVLREALEAHEWGFAAKSQRLARKNAPGRQAYPIRYALPSDCLRPNYFDGHESREPNFIIEGKDLLTSVEPAVLIYTADITNPKALPPTFVTAISYGLASFLASANNNDLQLQNSCQQKYMVTLAEAWALDQQQQNPRRVPSAWHISRFGESG